MGGLSKTGTFLVAVLAFVLVGVTAQLAYVLWWRRRFRRRSIDGGDPATTPPTPSKELLYYFLFCYENKQSRIEPATAPPLETAVDDAATKWGAGESVLCGLPRALFTIAEEEREGSCADASTAATSKSDYGRTVEIEESRSLSLREYLREGIQNDVVEPDHHEETPFSTPSASPPYYTPSPSPGRDDVR